MSVTRINEFHAAPGQSEALHAFLTSILAQIAAADGMLAVQLLRGVQAPDTFAIIEQWQSIAHHQAAATLIPAAQIRQIQPLLAAPPRGSYFQAC